jgi:hypothetical protein
MDAEALHIPVFKSTGEAQRLAWPKPRRRKFRWHPPRKDLREKRELILAKEVGWRSHPAARILAFLVGVLAVLTLVALFIPSAQITLAPVSKVQSLVLPVVASPAVESVFITGSIPAHEKRVIVDGTQTVNVTGEGVVPQSKSKGIVEFRNLTQQSVSIPAGTVVRNTDGIRFVTTVDSEVEAGVGKILQLPVEAVEGGIASNLDPETITVIEGRLGLSLSVTNPKATSGGRELPSVQASDADRERVKSLLMETLEEQARQEFEAGLNPGDLPLDQTMTVSQVLAEEYDPPAGAAGTDLKLDMRVEYVSHYAAASDLTELASLALNASLPSGFRIAAPGTLSVSTDTQPVTQEDGSTKWDMRAERKIVQQIDPARVTQMVQGGGAWNIKTKLKESLPLSAAPVIQLTPPWWPWMPIVPFRISVVTE